MRGTLRRIAGAVGLVTLAALGTGLLSSGTAFADGPEIKITSFEAQVGHEGKVDLMALGFGEPGLGAWTIDIHYNPEIVTLLECDAEVGGVCNAEFAENAVRIAGGAALGLEGDSLLGSLWFACKKPGSSDLGLSIEVLADGTLGDPQPIEAKVKYGEIECREEPAKPLGDVNCDGEVTSVDAALILQYEAEKLDVLECPEQGDLNGDGSINSVDAAIVLQIVGGLLDD